MDPASVVQGDTEPSPDQGPSHGSLSIQVGGDADLPGCRAAARQARRQQAATQLGASADQLSVADGVIRTADGGRAIRYGDLIGGKGFLKLTRTR